MPTTTPTRGPLARRLLARALTSARRVRSAADRGLAVGAAHAHGLPVYQYLDLSSAHTQPGELELLLALTAGATGPRTIRHQWGAWVNVPEGPGETTESLHAIEGLCPAVAACVKYARGLGCQWINFDVDADTVPALAQYDHSEQARGVIVLVANGG